MDNATFNKLVEAARIRQDGILKVKGHDYSGEVDRVANFKRVGENLGITPATALAVYMHKHWDSIMTFVREGKVQSEPIVGRLDDMHNYLYLLEGLIKEETPTVRPGPLQKTKVEPKWDKEYEIKYETASKEIKPKLIDPFDRTPIPSLLTPKPAPVPAPIPMLIPTVFGMDVDGVCANFDKGIIHQMRQMDLRAPDEDEVREYGFGRWRTAFEIAFNKVKYGANFWMQLEPYPVVLPFIPVVYVTARPIDSLVTWLWLNHHGFPIAPVVTIVQGESKVDVLQRYGVTVYVEDRPDFFKEINSAGIKCYLMDRPWNQEVKAGKLRIKELREMAEVSKELREMN